MGLPVTELVPVPVLRCPVPVFVIFAFGYPHIYLVIIMFSNLQTQYAITTSKTQRWPNQYQSQIHSVRPTAIGAQALICHYFPIWRTEICQQVKKIYGPRDITTNYAGRSAWSQHPCHRCEAPPGCHRQFSRALLWLGRLKRCNHITGTPVRRLNHLVEPVWISISEDTSEDQIYLWLECTYLN